MPPQNKPVQSKPQASVLSNGGSFFEPLKPGAAPIVDLTVPQPLFPKGQPAPVNPAIGALDKAGPGWKAEPIPISPEDDLFTKRPGFSGVTKI